MSGVEVIGFVLLTLTGFALTGLYAGLETGLYTINRVRLTVLAAGGDHSAVRLRYHLQHGPRTLAVLLLGTNASSYVGTYGLTELLHGTGLADWTLIALEVAIITPIIFVFAETLPKDLFCTHTDRWTYRLAPVISLSRALFTATGLLPGVQLIVHSITRLLRGHEQSPVTARQRMSHLISEGVGAGFLAPSQAVLTDRVLAMRSQRVSRVMVPWRTVMALPLEASSARRESLISRHPFTRFPVVDRGARACGILTWTDAVLDPSAPTAAMMATYLSFAPDTPVLAALSTMREARQAMAIVEDPETRRPLGLVTMKDLVEPLTGELAAW